MIRVSLFVAAVPLHEGWQRKNAVFVDGVRYLEGGTI